MMKVSKAKSLTQVSILLHTAHMHTDFSTLGLSMMEKEGKRILEVPANVQVEGVVLLPSDWEQVRIEVGERSHVTICQMPTSEKVEQEVLVGAEAQCTMVLLSGPDIMKQEIAQEGHIASGAELQWWNGTFGGHVRHMLKSRAIGPHAVSSVDWIAYTRGTEKQTLSARNIFEAAEGGGEINMRGVAEEKGHIHCNGLIEIGLKGGGTDTYLTQEVLMLDASAKVDAVPGLEIKTNDVKASHSATVARVTPEDLFYFGSRGIPEREARAMFIEGFLGELVEKIADKELQESILEYITSKYAGSRHDSNAK